MAIFPRASLQGTLLPCCLGLLAVAAAARPAAAAERPVVASPKVPADAAAPAPTDVDAPPTLSSAAPVANPPRGPGLRLNWAQVRADAWLVQNTQGNAYALQLGYTPQLRLRDVPLGLRLLAEFGALRDSTGRVFVAPSAQLLVTWQPVPHVELGLGAGVQVWCVRGGLVQPVATAEAHYLPHRRVAKVIQSVFVGASAGASAGAGLQVRLGLSLDFQRPMPSQNLPPRATRDGLALAAAAPLHLQAPHLGEHGAGPACPPCAPAQVASAMPAAPVPPEDVLLAVPLTFAFNACTLSAGAVAELRALGAALVAEPAAWRDLEVVGHADSVGTLADNQRVSERRAEAVRGVLEEAGVIPSRVVARGVGKTRPIVGERLDAASQRRATLRLRGLTASTRLQAFVRPDAARSAVPPG